MENKLNFARTLIECVEPWLIALVLDKQGRNKTFKSKRKTYEGRNDGEKQKT